MLPIKDRYPNYWRKHLEELSSRLKTKEAELPYLSFSHSEDLILLKSTFVERQGRRLRNFLYVYKPLTLRISDGFASISRRHSYSAQDPTPAVRLCMRHFTEQFFKPKQCPRKAMFDTLLQILQLFTTLVPTAPPYFCPIQQHSVN